MLDLIGRRYNEVPLNLCWVKLYFPAYSFKSLNQLCDLRRDRECLTGWGHASSASYKKFITEISSKILELLADTGLGQAERFCCSRYTSV